DAGLHALILLLGDFQFGFDLGVVEQRRDVKRIVWRNAGSHVGGSGLSCGQKQKSGCDRTNSSHGVPRHRSDAPSLSERGFRTDAARYPNLGHKFVSRRQIVEMTLP